MPTNPLIQPDELAAALQPSRDAPVLLDVRWQLGGPPGRDAYLAGHLPGAVFVDLDRELAAPPGGGGRHPLPASAAFQAAMRRCGVRGDRAVVVYDQRDTTSAARAWWLLGYHGHADVRVLDGGYDGWAARGLEVTTEVPRRAGAGRPGRGAHPRRPQRPRRRQPRAGRQAAAGGGAARPLRRRGRARRRPGRRLLRLRRGRRQPGARPRACRPPRRPVRRLVERVDHRPGPPRRQGRGAVAPHPPSTDGRPGVAPPSPALGGSFAQVPDWAERPLRDLTVRAGRPKRHRSGARSGAGGANDEALFALQRGTGDATGEPAEPRSSEGDDAATRWRCHRARPDGCRTRRAGTERVRRQPA